MDVSTGLLQPDEAEADARLRAQAFQHSLGPYYDPETPVVSGDRVHVARSASKIVGTATVLPLGQWFGGVALPMGGVAGVAVAPEVRGHGVARRLMTEALEAMRDRGEMISALYPTASPLYRSVGYEFGGRWERTTVNVSQLALLAARRPKADAGLEVEALAPGGLQRLRPLYDRLAEQSNGWLARSDLFWDRMNFHQNSTKSNTFGYAITDGGVVVGGLTVAHRPSENRYMFDVDIDGPFALSTSAFDVAIDLIAGLGATAERASLGMPVETAAIHLPGGILEHRESWLWMFRLVDVGAALATRGYNPTVSATLRFNLADQSAPWNNGSWELSVAGGRATAEQRSAQRDNAVGLNLDVQTLASVFTGFISPWDLATAGRLRGADVDTLHVLDALFYGRPPRLVDFF
jgi:predicted acetyltransferase